MKKDYFVIVSVVVLAFLLLYFNPELFQNKRYLANGNNCPDASWHALILFIFGTILYFFVHTYEIIKM